MKKLLLGAAVIALTGCSHMHGLHHDADAVEAPEADKVVAEAVTEAVEEPMVDAAEVVMGVVDAPGFYAALLAHADRPEGDNEDDAARKPAAVLEFAGVEAGMSVYEIEAGGGYYTELLSRAVGPEGSVMMQNPAGFDRFLGDSVEKRLADDRLANVTLRKSNFDDLAAEDGSMDMVTWMLGPHELWLISSDGEGLGDPVASFAQIAAMLKPGGTFVVVDHAADAGSPATTGGETHRIDPQIIKDMAAVAGLEFVGSSDLLASSDDDHTLMVFDPEIRRKTDRFVFKFRK